MNRIVVTILLLSLALACACIGDSLERRSSPPDEGQPITYGEPERFEPFEIDHPTVRRALDASVVLVDPWLLEPLSGGGYELDAYAYGSFGSYEALCDDEPYWDQPIPGSCSGFQVGDDLIATAGHCIETEDDCAETAVVFGFQMRDERTLVSRFPASDVYRCVEVVASANRWDDDYAIVRVDRAIEGHRPLPLRHAGAIEDDRSVTALISVSHPAGLPAKVIGGPTAIGDTGLSGATVMDGSATYFQTNLDVYAGSSGGLVFSVDELGRFIAAEGVVAQGNEDYVWTGSCYATQVCSDTWGCLEESGSGFEDVSRATRFAHHVPGWCGDDRCGGDETCQSCGSDCGACRVTRVFEEDFTGGLGQWSGERWGEGSASTAPGYPSAGSGAPVATAFDCGVCDLDLDPVFDLLGADDVRLSFWLALDEGASLSLWFWDGASWGQADRWTSLEQARWRFESLDVPAAYRVADFGLGFRLEADSGGVALDDLRIERLMTRPQP